MHPTSSADNRPRFTVVTAAYNVGRYLAEFIASVEAQAVGPGRLQVVAVDDGSTDDSLAILQEWRRRRPDLVEVLSQPNAGQAAARNLGLAHARGEWVTFADPDDVLDARYFAHVDAFLTRHPDVAMVGTRRRLFTTSVKDLTEHPLDAHFAGGDRRVDLREEPSFFHGSAPAAFFPLAELRKLELQFDPQIRPNFEDGHFCSRYLLAQPAPIVGFLASAEYLYRKRPESTLGGSWTRPTRYTVVPERGYLDLLRRGAESSGAAPEWLQNFVLYELSWYFTAEDRPAGAQTAATGAVADTFWQLLGRIAAHLEPRVIESFDLVKFRPVWREVLLLARAPDTWRPTSIARDRRDRQQRLARFRYRFGGEPPTEKFFLHGKQVLPLHQKTRPVRYFDRVVLRERVLWLPQGELHCHLDGVEVEVLKRERRRSGGNAAGDVQTQLRPGDWFTRLVARTPPVRRLFGSAWVLIDRLQDADDSAEHLFRYLRKNHPKTNAWFVIEKSAPDYRRLRADGFRRRVVPYGSWRWKLLMLNCRHLISSHADRPIHRPLALRTLVRRPRWRFTFLQHGVTKDDLSSWLNFQNIDLFITNTPAEHAYVVGDEAGYIYTTKEAQLTGLPRFDVIRRAAELVPPADRDLILLAPTWRYWLFLPSIEGTQRRAGVIEDVLESEFVRSWSALFSAPRLHELAHQQGLQVAALLHPNLEQVADQLGLPAGLQRFGFDNGGGARLFARCRALVTDYSSMAFNVAYIDRPVVYFQFDRERFLDGGHVGRRGYFDYDRDGFGPVAFDLDGVLDAITRTVACGPAPQPMYQARIDAAFPVRDGNCCKRVVAAVRASTRSVQPLHVGEEKVLDAARGLPVTATAHEEG